MDSGRRPSRPDVEHMDLETLLRRPSLRATIPRRISQVCREASLTETTTCGVACVRGKWLQSFANRTSFSFVYGVLGSFYGAYYAYFYGTITTLEKRFGLSSQTVGVMATVSDQLQIILSSVLSLWLPKLHKPRWMGLGMCAVVASAVMASLPHFLYGPGPLLPATVPLINESLPSGRRACPGEAKNCIRDPTEYTWTIFLLTGAQILHGIGGALYFTLGRGYNEENIQKYQGPPLLSLLSILKILGPGFGYWLSSMCLKVFISPNLVVDMNEDSVHWTGAWWLGNLMIGFLLFIPGMMMALFPATLPKAAVGKIVHETIRMMGNKPVAAEETPPKSLLINFTFKSNNFASVLNILGFLPYFVFLPKYVQIQYRLSASNANLVMGSLTLIFSACGIVIASSIISRYRPPARAFVGWKVVVDVLSIGSLFSFIYLGCPGNDEQISAMAAQYGDNPDGACGCAEVPLSPVCSEAGKTFFSSCHALCKDYNSTQRLINCIQSTDVRVQHKGLCPVDCYFNFILFTIITSSTSFIFATGYTSYFWLETKYTDQLHKSSVLQYGMAFLSFITLAPVQIIFGHVFDKYCLLWNDHCTGTGNCWLYDTENLRIHMNLIAVGFSIIGIIYDVTVWFSAKDVQLIDDDQYVEDGDEY